MDLCNDTLNYFSNNEKKIINSISKKNILKITNHQNTLKKKEGFIMKIYHYLNKLYENENKNEKQFIKIKNISHEIINSKQKINILKFLKIFCIDRKDYILQNTKINNEYLDLIKNLLITCIEYQEKKKKLLKKHKYKLRKYIEISNQGKLLIKIFFDNLLATNLIAEDYKLLFNPYTSIINLNEIYLQVQNKYTIDVELSNTFFKFKNYTSDNTVNQNLIYKDRIIIFTPNDKIIKKITLNQYNSNNKLISYDSKYLYEMLTRCFIFNYLLQTTIFPKNIQFFLINFKKEMMQIKEKGDIIFTSSEINTGVTNGKQIIMTRFEESLKTIIHELIHYHDLDFKNIPFHLTEFCLKNFDIKKTTTDFYNNPNILIFEAYTESYASIINMIYYSYLNPKKNNNLQKGLDLLNFKNKINKYLYELLSKQILYTILKISHILKTIGCETIDDFIFETRLENKSENKLENKLKNKSENKSIGLYEDTNLFAYYFIKLYFYIHLDELIIKCCKKETGKFVKSKLNYEIIKNIIKKGKNNKNLNNIINHLLSNNIFKKNDKYKNSLKMVCLN